jgi:hypothetical protein
MHIFRNMFIMHRSQTQSSDRYNRVRNGVAGGARHWQAQATRVAELVKGESIISPVLIQQDCATTAALS